MVDFLKNIELSDQKHQTGGNGRDENYKGNYLFLMKDFLSFRTDRQSMYFMSTILLKYNINRVIIPQFQLAYICYPTHPSNKNWLSCGVNYIIRGGKINIWN